ncbi:MAG: rhamnan synthesis F family protein [Lachnospiraceae bacterium]|nr:rhamnan synthesis F family protein [Lachnospiraceae bacterium]
MNRLCIYMTYNKNHKIQEYIAYALRALKQCCTDIYFVCNYMQTPDGLEYVQPYVERIYYHENIGYDSGAYKDVLFDFIGWDKVYEYDELILTNDSYWGFFFPVEDYFAQMASVECDFWGMTGQAAGEFTNPLYQFEAHVHSYFLVFRKEVLHSEAFKKFWERFKYPVSFREAVVKFEIQINVCLRSCGFKGASLMDLWNIALEWNVNPYYQYPYELIAEHNFPILKKKALLIRNPGFPSALKAVRYLKEKKLYPTEWMEEIIENQFYLPKFGERESNSLNEFYHRYSKIYIYGNGVCGKNLAVYFEYKGWRFEHFLVTKPSDSDAMSIDQVNIESTAGIIISVLNPQAAEEIASEIGEKCSEERLFFISQCKAIQLPI